MLTDPHTLSGETLGGRYQILRDLGEESLGRTYAAKDLDEDGRLVQIKAISPSIGGDEETFARFGREISASFMVSHPNTVEVFDFGQEGEVRYLVSEYLAAHPVSNTLDAGRLPVDRVAAIAAQVASAIGAAHQEGIVHRALSPETVLLLENAQEGDYVKVRDFGLAKLEDGGDEPEVTRNDVRVGGAAYMAPEYIESGRFHTKGDLYSLGCMVFELVAGRPPFQGERSDLLHQHVAEPPPRLSAVAPECPEWLDDLVVDLLAKKPADRPGAYKVVQRLEAGVGHPLSPPALWPLDDDGTIRVSEVEESTGGSKWILGLLVMGLIGGVAFLVIGVAAVAAVALVLSLPT